MSRPGKITLLPKDVREELNRRLDQGLPGRRVLAWLNGLPDVKEVLGRFFNGRPVNAPNLTHWRQSGYAEWQVRRQLMKSHPNSSMTGDEPDGDGLRSAFANRAAELLSLRYVRALSPSVSGSRCAGGIHYASLASLKHLRAMTHQITTLRRSELRAARHKLPASARSATRRLKLPKPRAESPPSRISKTWSWNFGHHRPRLNSSVPPPPEP
jgi:hypothetical protein